MRSILLSAFALTQLVSPSPKAPYRQPQLAASANLVAMAFGSGSGVYVATSTDRGETFAKPVKIAESPNLMLGRHRGPRIAISGSAIVVTAVMSPTPNQGDLFAWTSVDNGRTWSKGVRVNDVAAATQEGLDTVAGDSHGAFFAAWLDARQPGKRLYGAWSSDGGVTWSKNTLIYESPDGKICDCCHPSAAFDERGGLDVMWRNALAGSRDLYLAHADDGRHFGPARKLGVGTWKLDACPMDGGGIAHEGMRTVTAWRRGEELFLDEPGKPEQKLGDGKDVAVAAAGDRFAAVWIGGSGLHSMVGRATEIPASQVLAPQAAFPSVVAVPGAGFLAAWEENGAISVRRLP